MHVLVEIHHLETIELVGHCLDVGLLVRLLDLNALCVPTSSKTSSITIDHVLKFEVFPYHFT